MSRNASLRLFYSYSRTDEEFRKELEKHLSILRRNGLITEWYDREISAGEEWEGVLNKELERAQIILLLISADFISSNYCYDVEMKTILEKHENGEAIVIPIIIRPTFWQETPFAKLQVLPKDAKPVSIWQNKDEAWLNIVKEIKRVCEKFTRNL